MNPGAFGSALVKLDVGESFVSESGAMFRASVNVEIEVSTKSRGKGGILSGLKRLLGGESFFYSTYTLRDGQPGEVGLAPTLQGEVAEIVLAGGSSVVCAGGSYLASDTDLQLELAYQGLGRGLLGGESLFFIQVSGHGSLLVNAYGRITALDIEDELVVDSGHLVAFEETLEYQLTKTNAGWIKSFVSGEGLVMHFRGRGRIWVQSHNPKEFGTRLGRRLPPRQG